MTTRMLIDAAHPEETRVVVVKGSRLEEFDMESATRQQLRGNIYLAKVTRVEPSLQAAFIDYGGNRHGFLAFSDIHPDYYQIPIADREALLEQQAAIQAAQDLSEEEADNVGEASDSADELDVDNQSDVEDHENASWEEVGTSETDDKSSGKADALDDTQEVSFNNESGENLVATEAAEEGQEDNDDNVSNLTGYEGIADLDEWRRQLTRRYKIQEVIKRRQILLVQVVKEERGNKGAALTTYLSLAGRYCVLMPNSTRGGGISRKITNSVDRKKLREVIEGLNVPDGMRLIVRTAGQSRNKAEMRRDYEYLLRFWDKIRELTLSSTAPSLIYEDADIIKRSIRDLYTKDISEILVDGEEGHKSAKSFMKMLMPSHAKRVQPYQDRIPLFQRYRVEEQFSSMHSPTVQLKSGGYIVINPTEALVAVDVNSGRSTRERNIEETAYKTNLEAAEEIARQLRLRDLAGLIVIDFIDMDENRNARRVEKCLKDCLKTDRARIQLGRISNFGLLEMSRQRLRPSLIEASTEVCPLCQGAGVVRSTESSALHVLHAIEEEGIQGHSAEITVHMATVVALYILNQKRDSLIALEERFGLRVNIEGDDTLNPPEYRLERISSLAVPEKEEKKEKAESRQSAAEVEESSEDTPKKRRRRGSRGGRRRRKKEENAETAESSTKEQEALKTEEEHTKSSKNESGRTNSQQVIPEKVSRETTAFVSGKSDSSEVKVNVSAESEPKEQTASNPDPVPEEAMRADPIDVASDAGIDATESHQEDKPSLPSAGTEHALEREESMKPKRRGWWQGRKA
jgi:ribonuclease E